MKRLAEIAFFAPDVDRTARFYGQLLGTAPASQQQGETATFMLGGARLFLHKKGEPPPGFPPGEDHIAFAVADVDRECETLRPQGAAILLPPRDYYWGRSAYLRDPDGRLLELHQDSG